MTFEKIGKTLATGLGIFTGVMVGKKMSEVQDNEVVTTAVGVASGMTVKITGDAIINAVNNKFIGDKEIQKFNEMVQELDGKTEEEVEEYFDNLCGSILDEDDFREVEEKIEEDDEAEEVFFHAVDLDEVIRTNIQDIEECSVGEFVMMLIARNNIEGCYDIIGDKDPNGKDSVFIYLNDDEIEISKDEDSIIPSYVVVGKDDIDEYIETYPTDEDDKDEEQQEETEEEVIEEVTEENIEEEGNEEKPEPQPQRPLTKAEKALAKQEKKAKMNAAKPSKEYKIPDDIL